MMTKIFIACPAMSYTGGPTLAHQLCFVLREKGFDASMWYQLSKLKKYRGQYVHEYYAKTFNNDYTIKKPDDTKDNVIIALESNVALLNGFKKAKKLIWWMSVDNFYNNMLSFFDKISVRLFHKNVSIERKKRHENSKKYRVVTDDNVIHLYQSEYARRFLISKGINEDRVFRLSDYIEDEILLLSKERVSSKERNKNAVLYNPKKGFEFTKKIIERLPEIDWMPLQNMNKREISDRLLHSRLYIDFGEHPGKDRFPREAVLLGCCIITGRRGSAGNDIDVAIPTKYKFDDSAANLENIAKTIINILGNYQECYKDFLSYRDLILKEKEVFYKDIDFIFDFVLKDR